MSIDRAMRANLMEQYLHWHLALQRLARLDDIASQSGWRAIERQTNTLLRATLLKSVTALTVESDELRRRFDHMATNDIVTSLQRLRRNYLRTEVTLDFFADAINTRTSEHMSGLLSAADALAGLSMRRILRPLGKPVPPVVSYIDKGLGASILKAGLRLWDQSSVNPVAMIKIVRHNILRPTALLHEAGHQVAHMVDWNDQLAGALTRSLPGDYGSLWGGWASEIAADAFAFANAGFASVAALRNVVDGGRRVAFRYLPGDPHPISYLRVMLGAEMCRCSYGAGPWDDMARVWGHRYPLREAPSDIRNMIKIAARFIPVVARITLRGRYAAFDGKSLAQVVDPLQVSPGALDRFERSAGPRLFASPLVANREGLRLLALSGYRFATQPQRGADFMARQMDSMLLLGRAQSAA